MPQYSYFALSVGNEEIDDGHSDQVKLLEKIRKLVERIYAVSPETKARPYTAKDVLHCIRHYIACRKSGTVKHGWFTDFMCINGRYTVKCRATMHPARHNSELYYWRFSFRIEEEDAAKINARRWRR